MGKLPPQNKDIEEVVLGAIMIENDSILPIETMFKEEVFYVDAHQRIAGAIRALRKKKAPIDLLTVVEQLKSTAELESVGGITFIAQLTNKVGSAAHVEYHYRIILENFIKRQAIHLSSQIISSAYEDTTDAFELIQSASNNARELDKIAITGSSRPMELDIDEAANRISEMCQNKGDSKFLIKSKHYSINKNMMGWVKGSMTIIAARPGMGKSAFLISEVYYLVQQGKKVLVFNLEMTKEQFFIRLWCLITGIPNTRVKANQLTDTEKILWKQAIQWTKDNAHLLILYFKGGMEIDEIEAIVRLILPDATFIDHLQFVKNKVASKRGTRDIEIGDTTSRIKATAKNVDTAIVLFSHLSRKVEERKDKRPHLEDLRESGNIENDADVVLFLLRPEYYFERDANGNIKYKDAEQEAYKQLCQVFCEKNRDGANFQDEWQCIMSISMFRDMHAPPQPTSDQKGLEFSAQEVLPPVEEDLPF